MLQKARTNDSCVSFNTILNGSFYASHLIIFNFVKILVQFLHETNVNLRSTKGIRRKINLNKEDFLKETMNKYEQN